MLEQLAQSLDFKLSDLLAERDPLETSSKGIDCAFIGDSLGRVFEDGLALDIGLQ